MLVLQSSDSTAFSLPPGQSLSCPPLQFRILDRVPVLHVLEHGPHSIQDAQTVINESLHSRTLAKNVPGVTNEKTQEIAKETEK